MVINLFENGIQEVEELQQKPVVTGVVDVTIKEAKAYVHEKDSTSYGLKLVMVTGNGEEIEEVIWQAWQGKTKKIDFKSGGSATIFDMTMNDICRNIGNIKPADVRSADVFVGKKMTIIMESTSKPKADNPSELWINCRIQWYNKAQGKPSGWKRPKEGYSQDNYVADQPKPATVYNAPALDDDDIPF